MNEIGEVGGREKIGYQVLQDGTKRYFDRKLRSYRYERFGVFDVTSTSGYASACFPGVKFHLNERKILIGIIKNV